MRERELVARIDDERLVERFLGVLVSAVIEDARTAQHERIHAARVLLQGAIEIALGLAAIEHRVRGPQAVHPKQRFLDISVLFEHLLQVLLAAREPVRLAIDLKAKDAERESRRHEVLGRLKRAHQLFARSRNLVATAESPATPRAMRERFPALRLRTLQRGLPDCASLLPPPHRIQNVAALVRCFEVAPALLQLRPNRERFVVVALRRERARQRLLRLAPAALRFAQFRDAAHHLAVVAAAQFDLQQPAARGQQHVLRWAILFALFLRSLKDLPERVLGGAKLALIEVLLRVLQQHLELVGVVLRAQRATADEERREHELRDEAQPTHMHRRTIGPRRARVERRRVRRDYCSPYSRILR